MTEGEKVIAEQDGFIQASQLRSELADRFDPIYQVVMDEEYILPSEDWLFGAFYGGYEAYMRQQNAGRYREETGDCDDYAWLMQGYARLLAWRQRHNRPLAVGLISYKTGKRRGHRQLGHVANVALTWRRRSLVALLIEPQNGSQIDKRKVKRCDTILV